MTRGSDEIASKELRTLLSIGTTDCCANTDGWIELSSAAKLRAKKTVLILKDNSGLLEYSAYEGFGLCLQIHFYNFIFSALLAETSKDD